MDMVKNNNPVWAEIDLQAIASNLKLVKQLVGAKTKIMSVVKADGYGHGSIEVARTIAASGTDAFGVARFDEGVALRKSGLQHPILVFGYTPPEAAEDIIKYGLRQTVFSKSYAELLNEKARIFGGRIKVHVKIDTGMGRLGFVPEHLNGKHGNNKDQKSFLGNDIASMSKLTNLAVDGIYTHLASSDSADKTSARNQLTLFNKIVSFLETEGLHFPDIHAANSAAIVGLPESHLTMVRPGIMLYGLHPSVDHQTDDNVVLQPAMQVKARIAQIKDVPDGFKVSYGHSYVTPGATRLATVPVGYADGYNWRLSSTGVMLVGGYRAPVVGRVCMDQSVLDVGHIEGIRCGDEVVIMGRQKKAVLSAEEIADQLGTINYEIVSTIMARVPRLYKTF